VKSETLVGFVAVLVVFAAGGCRSAGRASPPAVDHEDGRGKPVFEPMLVVPMPALHATRAPEGRAVEALQARRSTIGDVLLALFKDSDVNLLVDPSVQATECTFDIKRSTVEETFEALLHSLDLGYEWDGSFLRVRDVVRETLHVDMMDGGAATGNSPASGSSGTGMAANVGGSADGGQDGFWDRIEGILPVVLGDGARTVVNRAASTIHVEARPSGVERLRELVATTVRRANKQVSIEARILEVRLDDAHSLGVNWSLLPGLFHSNKTGLASGGGVVTQTAAAGATSLTFGLLEGGDFSVVVDALERQGEVRVLSSPRVSTMNNQTASIRVTDQIPVITREVIDDEGVARTEFGVEFVEAGVVLQVRPMIGEDGILSVAITPQVREQTGTVVTPDGLVQVPILSAREATTLVRVSDGQAIALGGLRSTRKNETRQGVPFLMDVPFVGQLFSSTVQARTEVELMILLTPRVLDDTWIAEEVRRGAHRLVQLRRGFQWNSIALDGFRPEDWSGGSLQGHAETAESAELRVPLVVPPPLPPERGLTVTRAGLSAHLLVRAQRELDAGQAAAALASIEKAIELEPRNGAALVAAGVLLAQKGNVPRARLLLERALELAPRDVVALAARGALELTDGSAFAARRWLERAHELGDTALTAANLGAALLVLGEFAAAREVLLTKADPAAPPELHANLAYAELKSGHVDAARVAYHQALVAGADARSPRLVALGRLVAAAEVARQAGGAKD
jgi:MSHA biogenesis protein MshL